MPTETATIDSTSQEDISALLSDLCENGLNMDVTEAKRKFLGFYGKDKAVNDRAFTIEDVLKVAQKGGAKILISVTYERHIITGEELAAREKLSAPEPHETTPVTMNAKRLENQKEDITNPELQDIVKNSIPSQVVLPEIEKPAVTPAVKIPKFKLD